MKNIIVGITGYAQHGKDTVASTLVEEFGYTKVAFADKLREVALALDPIIAMTNEFPAPIRLSHIVNEVGWDQAKKLPEIRRTLQRVGTEVGRNVFGENVWIELAAITASQHRKVVITDVRFPNEAAWITKSLHQTLLIRVTRPGFNNGVGTTHPSEQFIAKLPADLELINDGTLEQLQEKVRAFACELEEVARAS